MIDHGDLEEIEIGGVKVRPYTTDSQIKHFGPGFYLNMITDRYELWILADLVGNPRYVCHGFISASYWEGHQNPEDTKAKLFSDWEKSTRRLLAPSGD